LQILSLSSFSSSSLLNAWFSLSLSHSDVTATLAHVQQQQQQQLLLLCKIIIIMQNLR
jgi:hypothetical protein